MTYVARVEEMQGRSPADDHLALIVRQPGLEPLGLGMAIVGDTATATRAVGLDRR
jgi:hypothetical protein